MRVVASEVKRISALLGSGVFLVAAPGTVAGLVPWLLTHWKQEPPLLGLAVLRPLGALLLLPGLFVLLDSFLRFALQGLGTPAPVLPTRHLVVTGLYRYVRNPMYLAVLSIVVGQGLLFGSERVLAYALIVFLAFHAFVVLYEEPTLRDSFGVEYEAFFKAVPRWLPRLEAWPGPPRGDPQA